VYTQYIATNQYIASQYILYTLAGTYPYAYTLLYLPVYLGALALNYQRDHNFNESYIYIYMYVYVYVHIDIYL